MKLPNGEWSVEWDCPACGEHQTDSVHHDLGPYVSCICHSCQVSFYDGMLDEASQQAWNEARDSAEVDHDWQSTDNPLIDRCAVCGEERA